MTRMEAYPKRKNPVSAKNRVFQTEG